MTDEQLRVFLILHAFYNGVTTLAVEYDAKTITAERLADRVKDLSKAYEARLLKKDERP